MYMLKCYLTGQICPKPGAPERTDIYTASAWTKIDERQPLTTARTRVLIDRDDVNDYYAFVSVKTVLTDIGDIGGGLPPVYAFVIAVQRTFRKRSDGISGDMLMNGPAMTYILECGEFQHCGDNFGNLKMFSVERTDTV